MSNLSNTNVKTIDFRDQTSTYLEGVKRPAFLYDITLATRLKYGEYEDVMNSLTQHKEAYEKAGFAEMANNLAVLEVEPNQELIDDLFQSSGRFEIYIRNLQTHHSNGLH